MDIPSKDSFDNYDLYKLAIDKYFFAEYGFKEWITKTIDERVDIIEKLITPVSCNYYEYDEPCNRYNRYEKGGLK
tara:strand:+ start:2134 stop:2358 length:225 start_codon:yes stop_codon:yes gene_type:complete